MPVRIALCDDDPLAIKQLSEALQQYDPGLKIHPYADGKTLVTDVEDGVFDADLLFLDVCMPEMDGIETARRVRTVMKDLKIVFLTSSTDFYSQAYEVFAFNYLVKPVQKERLNAVLDRALEELHKERGYQICIQYKGVTHRIDCRNILYAESQNKMILFHLVDGTVLKCYGKMEEIFKNVYDPSYFRCHQSFIVNLSHVTEAGDNYFRIGQTTIAISRKYIKEAKAKYYESLFSRM